MSSLAGTTEKLRSVLKIGGIIGVIFFLIYLLIMGGILVKNVLFPSSPLPPEQSFGELPSLVFEQKAPPGITYIVNTSSGTLPENFPDRMFVYKISQPKADLLALQNTRRLVSSTGFVDNESKITDTIYQWTNPSNSSTIQVDIVDKNFVIRSNFLTQTPAVSNFPDTDEMKEDVSEFLSSLQVDLNSLTYKEDSFIYYQLVGNQLQQTTTIREANFVRVNLYNNNIQNDLGDFPFVYPNQEFPNVTLLMSYPSQTRMIVAEGESYDYQILIDEKSDYAIKSSFEALEELKKGNGYLFNPTNETSIEITEVYLAYYLDKTTNMYAQPVIVFKGIGAVGYVPAVKYIPQTEGTE